MNPIKPSFWMSVTRAWAWASLCGLLLDTALAQPTSINRVLDLDGHGSFVELPPNIFNDLTNATVEAWVKWRKFEGHQRFFCFGDYNKDFSVGTGTMSRESLTFGICHNTQYYDLTVSDLIRTNEWNHIGVTSGAKGMELYVNGVLVATNNLTFSFPDVGSGSPNYLGRLVSLMETYDFSGQIDEFRVWNVARSESEIQATMYQRLSGTEPGLVGLWNFEDVADGSAKDLGPGRHDGKLAGNARAVAAALPESRNLLASEGVLDLDGQGSYAQLPDHCFDQLTEGTVEARIRWDSMDDLQRFFSFGEFQNDMGAGIQGRGSSQELVAFVYPTNQGLRELLVPMTIPLPEWHQVALATGPGGMQLFFNGVLIATNASTKSFDAIAGTRNFIGGWNHDATPTVDTMVGQIAEFRVWNVARTEAEIRENMFRKLTGTEPELAGLWTFDSAEGGVVKDLSPGRHDARLMGNARVVSVTPDVNQALRIPAIIAGRVLDESGLPLTNVTVQLVEQSAGSSGTGPPPSEDLTKVTGAGGAYSFAFLPQSDRYELVATSGDLGARIDRLAVNAGDKLVFDLTLKRAVSISGRVAALDDSPLPNVVVQVVKAPLEPRSESGREAAPTPGISTNPQVAGSLSAAGPEVIETSFTDEKGQFTFVNLRPGPCQVRIQIPKQHL